MEPKRIEEDESGGEHQGGLIPSDAPAGEGEPKKLAIDLRQADDEIADEEERQQEKSPRPIRHKSQWRQMNEAHSAKVAELEKKLAQMEGRISAPREAPRQEPAPRQQQPSENPQERQVQRLWRMQQRTLAAIRSQQYAPEEVREMEDDWRQMDRERRALEARIDSPRQEEPRGPAADKYGYGRAVLESEFPEVFASTYLERLASAEEAYLHSQGKPDNIVTAREAARRVMSRRGIGRETPAPTDAEKARHSGVPGRAGATQTSSGPKEYVPTKYVMDLARAYTVEHPEWEDDQRYKHWRRYVGKPNGLVP